jgi:glycosyltransferase involved in cell wall biosynthesis
MRLSLIIPCYNEARNIPGLLDRCRLVTEGADAEIIIVDNGSTDDTPAVLAQLLPRCAGCRSVVIDRNQGYGHGIVQGLRAAKGDIIGWTHADLQADPVDVLTGLALFEAHGEDSYVKGKRYGRPLADVCFTIGMSCFETVLLGRPMWDINAQPNLFPRTFFQQLADLPDDFSLDLFTYYRAQTMGLKVRRFPVRFGDRAHGISHWNVNWQSKWHFIRRTMQFSLQLRKRL